MLPEWTIVGFTGHRHLADPRIAATGIRAALDQLAKQYGPLAAISSLAAGADTLFVKEMARRSQPFLLVLPFPKARFQQDFSAEDWQSVVPLLKQASAVEEIPIGDSAEEPYMEAGALMVDRVDVVVAVWDGAASAGAGGTGDVVAYARAMAKPLMIINPITGGMASERLEQLPANENVVLPADGGTQNARKLVEENFLEFDEAAKGHSLGVRHLISIFILLQFVTAALGLMALALNLHHTHALASDLVIVVELFMLVAAVCLVSQHRKKHHEWIRNRMQAEICRSFLATWHLCRHGEHAPRIAVQGFTRFCRNLRLLRDLDKSELPPLDAVRDAYLAERVQGQLQHFRRQYEKASRAEKKLKSLALVGTVVAAVATAATLVFSLMHFSEGAYNTAKVVSLLFPSISAALFSLIVTQDYARRSTRYKEMVGVLEDVEKRLKIIRTWTSLARVAAEVETELLQEIVEWRSFQRVAGEPR